MASSRADEVAEILFELKRAGKIATYSQIARRAGFSAGTNGRAMDSCLKVVRRDWPHLHWFRAVKDDGCVEATEQSECLKDAGFEIGTSTEGKPIVVSLDNHIMKWEEPAPVGT